jgi:hypothetical protein
MRRGGSGDTKMPVMTGRDATSRRNLLRGKRFSSTPLNRCGHDTVNYLDINYRFLRQGESHRRQELLQNGANVPPPPSSGAGQARGGGLERQVLTTGGAVLEEQSVNASFNNNPLLETFTPPLETREIA